MSSSSSMWLMSSRGDADVFMEVRPVASWNAIEFTFGVGATNREKKRAQQLRWGAAFAYFFPINAANSEEKAAFAYYGCRD